MKEKVISEKESLALIAEMIQSTKSRLNVGDGNMLLLWGYVSALVGLLVWGVTMATKAPESGYLWFLIPLVGWLLSLREKRKACAVPLAVTYVDKISAGIWKLVGLLLFIGIALCTGFMLNGCYCWEVMFVEAFLVVGFGSAVQGVVIRESSLVFGGIFSVSAGLFMFACILGGVPVVMAWAVPLYVVTFVIMMVIPGHIINRKARLVCPKN